MKMYIFAMAALGEGLSGSDRIFIELARRWSKKHDLYLFVWSEGFQMCQRQGLDKTQVQFKVVDMFLWARMGFFINYLARIFVSISIALNLKLINDSKTVVYSASDFWMDSLPGFILKLRFPKTTWIGSWYLTAPNPFKGFDEGKNELSLPKINILLYWISQQPIYLILKKWADFIFITSQPDENKFLKHRDKKKVIIISGGVNLASIRKWQKDHRNQHKKFDAIFQGRFHPQKGVLELIDIWEEVIDKIPQAKLVMIGDGPLMEDIKNKIIDLNLEDNIFLKGYLYDGEEKYKLFAQSKILVHPVIYDSGGMAAAEGMVFGLPGVSFDLEALKTYYPKGMLKASMGEKEEFADLIITLLEDRKLYNKISSEAKNLIEKYWDWDKRAEEVFQQIRDNDDKKLH